ncbi:coiled-coil-helix-coiled-coil-helix domain-containing protein 1 isoform X3 [Gallus gallus]|uniref:coiled-coil-helix-coiled-coil-helix domain-containing protein 1 isoform X3 n=1 Tax=Gallus gallus TaxID=9031 RepID=UPI001AEB2A52|nr:coiled-coil-helix-coiled-coil-helix domain-containing protein 1 isoform X3 [Gallus gallus]
MNFRRLVPMKSSCALRNCSNKVSSLQVNVPQTFLLLRCSLQFGDEPCKSFCADVDDQNGEHGGGFVSVPNLNAAGSWFVTEVPKKKTHLMLKQLSWKWFGESWNGSKQTTMVRNISEQRRPVLQRCQ